MGYRRWFSVDAKTFKITVEGEGRKEKGYITERRKGMVSWIRFREEGLSNLLKGVEICCKESSSTKRIFDWKENGRNCKLESRINEAGRFLLCSVTNGEDKRHKIFFLEDKGLVKGWSILAGKLRALGIKGKPEEKEVEKLKKELSLRDSPSLRS